MRNHPFTWGITAKYKKKAAEKTAEAEAEAAAEKTENGEAKPVKKVVKVGDKKPKVAGQTKVKAEAKAKSSVTRKINAPKRGA